MNSREDALQTRVEALAYDIGTKQAIITELYNIIIRSEIDEWSKRKAAEYLRKHGFTGEPISTTRE